MFCIIFLPILSPQTATFIYWRQFYYSLISFFPYFVCGSPTPSLQLFSVSLSFFLKNIGVFFSSKYLPFLSPKLLSFQNEVAVFLFSVPNFRFAKQALLPTETMPFALQDSLFCFSRAFTCGSRLCSVLSQSICLLPIKLCLLFYKALSVVFYKTSFVVCATCCMEYLYRWMCISCLPSSLL